MGRDYYSSGLSSSGFRSVLGQIKLFFSDMVGISCVWNISTIKFVSESTKQIHKFNKPAHFDSDTKKLVNMDLMLFFELDCDDCTLVYYEDCRRRKHREWEHNLWTMDRNQQKMIQHWLYLSSFISAAIISGFPPSVFHSDFLFSGIFFWIIFRPLGELVTLRLLSGWIRLPSLGRFYRERGEEWKLFPRQFSFDFSLLQGQD